MNRILIVDDEPEIADSVADMCRECEDIKAQIEVAYIGRKALELVKENDYDLLISDISMPGVSGFELLEFIKSNNINCRIIFLTGYKDFDYVYKAIQNDGVSYLIKTETDENILSCIKGVLTDVLEKKENSEMYERAQAQLRELSPVIQKEILERMFKGIIAKEEYTDESFLRIGIPFSTSKRTSVVIGKFDRFHSDLTTLQKYQFSYALKDIFEEYFPKRLTKVSFVNNDYLLVCVFQCDSNENQEDMNEQIVTRLHIIQKQCKISYDQTVSFAIASEFFDIENLQERYNDLSRLICLELGAKTEKILYGQQEDEKVNPISTTNLSGLYYQLSQDLSYRNETHFYNVLSRIAEQLMSNASKNDPRKQEIYINIGITLLGFINNNNLNEQLAFKVATYKLMRFDEHENWAEAVKYLYEVVNGIFAVLADENENKKTVIVSIHRYIDEHITDFSLNMLADTLHFNPSYLSRLYKNITGNKLQDYLLQKKLSLAIDSLEHSNEKINTIGNKVGYDTPQSFSRFFKRLTGYTPQEYRQKSDIN